MWLNYYKMYSGCFGPMKYRVCGHQPHSPRICSSYISLDTAKLRSCVHVQQYKSAGSSPAPYLDTFGFFCYLGFRGSTPGCSARRI